MTPDDPRQGTPAGYNAGCRCEDCWAAKQRYDKRRRWEAHQGGARKVPAYRAERRLQALQCLGWSIPVLARRLEIHHQSLYDIGRLPTIYTSRFDKIAALYDELCMTVPKPVTTSEKHSVTKTRRYAQRNGYAPPLAWDDIDNDEQPAIAQPDKVRTHPLDEVIVDRALGGEFSLATREAERAEVCRRWEGTLADLERLSGWNVHRYLRRAA